MKTMIPENTSLLILTNTSFATMNHLNESAIIFEIINRLVFLLASDLNLDVKFDTEPTKDQTYLDIGINIHFDEHFNLTSVWPFYQDWYCFIYSNSKKLTFDLLFMKSLTPKDYLIIATPIIITIIYHFLVLYFRLKKTAFDALGTAYLYAVQTFTNAATPNLEKYPHDKFFLTGLYIFIFVAMFTFLTFFSSCCTVPRFFPAADFELKNIREIQYSTSFGIGEQCVNEILTGTFERRSCMVPCSRAVSVIKAHWEIEKTNEINFRNAFKMSKNSKYFRAIEKLLTSYNEHGVLQRIFDEVNRESYKNLTTSTSNPVLTIRDMNKFILNTYIFGLIECSVAFGTEIGIWITATFVLPICRSLWRKCR